MKKILFLLVVALVLPLGVHAMAQSESFKVGDSVSVALYEGYDQDESTKNGIGFHVLKESKSGEQYVTLIYDGVLSGSATVYDEAIPGEHDVTSVLENSVVGQKLSAVVNAEGKKWRATTVTLLKEEDLTNLGITKNAAGIYEITEKYAFVAPIKVSGLSANMYNYWTQIKDSTAEHTSMYCVTYNESREGNTGVWATLESKDITSVTDNATCGIRPVVVIDKEYILCNNSEEPKNAETGVVDYILPLTLVIVAAGGAILLTKRNNAFKQI